MAIDYKITLGIIRKGSDVIFLNGEETYTSKFGRSGNYNGKALRYHDLAIDSDGHIYLGDILENKLMKYKKEEDVQ